MLHWKRFLSRTRSPSKVVVNEQVVFSLPEAMLSTAATSMTALLDPFHGARRDLLSFASGSIADHGGNSSLQLVHVEDSDALSASASSDALFSRAPGPELPASAGMAGTSFFRLVAGDMQRVTVTGEQLDTFDFVAHLHRCVASMGENSCQLVPAGEPVALQLGKLGFDQLVDNLLVWKRGRAMGVAHRMQLSLG